MAKLIKFNLILDEQPVRDLVTLGAHFNINDILDVYRNGLLSKWLSIRGYNEELTKVGEIPAESGDQEIITRLLNIFGIEQDEVRVREAIASIHFRQERERKLREFADLSSRLEEALENYHQGYERLVKEIKDNKDDFAYIKAAVSEMHENYYRLFRLDRKEIYYQLIEEAPLAIMSVMMHPTLRQLWLEDKDISASLQKIYSAGSVLEKISEQLKSFAGKTEGYWKDIEPKDKRVMVLSIESANYIRSAGKHGEEINAGDVNGHYLILDGLDYKSNNEKHKLLYLEV